MGRKPQYNKDFMHQALRLRRSGYTYTEITLLLGVSLGTVRNWVVFCQNYPDNDNSASPPAHKHLTHQNTPGTHRLLPPSEKLEVIRQAVEMRIAKKTYCEIAQKLGIPQTTVRYWVVNHFANDTSAALRPLVAPGNRERLTEAQKSKMRRCLFDCKPDELEHVWLLWDKTSILGWLAHKIREAVFQGLVFFEILEKFDIAVPALFRRGFKDTFTPPQKVFYQELLQQAYPARIPIISVDLVKTSDSTMILAKSRSNHHSFLIYREAPTIDQWIDFFDRLQRSCDNPVYVIIDALPILGDGQLVRWLKDNAKRVKLFIRKPYEIREFS